MIKLSLQQISEILNATLFGDSTVSVENVSTDTRQKTEKGLFFALKGEKFDAHDYLPQAVVQGCVAVVVDHFCETVEVPQLIVKDTRLALGELAKWLKAELNPKTVAMTGSSGKTTVKEMTASILQQTAGDPGAVLFTNGNFNNDIGVPLTLLRLEPKHKFAVIELGANHQGEIAYTTNLVRPDVALINNVAAAHLEGFGSIEGVAEAKGEIYTGVPDQGICIMEQGYSDLYYKPFWDQQIGDSIIRLFSVTDNWADYYATDIQLTETGATFTLHSIDDGRENYDGSINEGNITINLPYLGMHNVHNALAAASLALNVGANLEDVKAGLEQKSQVKGRLFPLQPCENLLLLDDTYNANVDSLKAAVDVLKKYQAFRILAVGDMAELGDNTQLCHQQVAEHVKSAELDVVVSFGTQSAVISEAVLGQHFTDKATMSDNLATLIAEKLKDNQKVVLLAKGSRSMKMEDVIYSLKDKFVC